MSSRQPVTILIHPWFYDHRFNGLAILPAVETMLILAQFVKKIVPQFPVRNIQDAQFSRFLKIPAESSQLTAFVEYERVAEDAIRISLLSRVLLKKMSRMQVHAELTFVNTPLPTPEFSQDSKKTGGKASIPVEQIYSDLVPFGPAYRSLTGTLQLTKNKAMGNLLAPDLPDTAMQINLGSPFPLDGAMHAACVLGQCSTGFIPFPVGFKHRIVYKPTCPGKAYRTEITAISNSPNEFICNLSLFDEDNTVCEQIHNLHMRDVSGGQLRPPDWIQNLL